MSRAVNLRHSVSQDGAIAYNERGFVVYACGDTAPVDGTAGYEVGCIFIDTNAADGSTILVNEGTAASCDFNTLTGGVSLAGLTATAAELNVAADGSANTVVVAAGGGAVTPLVGGGTYLIPLVTGNVTITLPAATLGEKHRFCFIGSAADAEDWVITSPTLFVGGFSHFDVGGTSAAAYANGSTHAIVTINNPAAGTDITFIGDGTNWACTGQVSSADIHAFS